MTGRPDNLRVTGFIYLALGLITLALYLPAVGHSFIEYDDQQYVTDNARVQSGLSSAGVIWAFGFHAGNWHPLAWLSHMLDCQIYGARAGGHHLTNVLLHVASTMLLALVLQRMTGDLWRCAAVAALFAWHPLHVESVAWVAERKDLLCAFFWMLTLYGYVRYVHRPGISRYLFALGLFALCLMAKPMAVTLPFVMLLLDFWPLNRIKGFSGRLPKNDPPVFLKKSWQRLVLEKIPFLCLSAITCVLTLHAQHIAIVSTAGLAISTRIAHTLVAYEHYFWAMFFPHNLAVYYPYVINLKPGTVVFAGLVLVCITGLVVKHLWTRPWLLVGWLWFLGTLVPVIGLVQVGDQAWADRYTYLPLIGLFVGVVWLAAEFIKNQTVLRTLAATVGVAMLAATSLQLRHWKNTWTLFDHANQVTKENYMAITVLASQLAQQGKLDEAIALYHTALSYKPTFPETHFFLGHAFDQLGRPEEAVAEYQKALWFKPMQEQTHIFLGMVLSKQKKFAEAITHYESALVINPESAVTHNNLARVYHTQGRLDDAIKHYSTALQLDPNLALAHNNLGILQLQKNNLTDGTRQLREALRLNPTNSETRFNLALALNQQQQWSEAVELFAKTVGAGSTDPKAHYEYATALARSHQTRAAMGEYAAALLLWPDYAAALDGLAWLLSTASAAEFRNGPEAVKLAGRACELTGQQDAEKLKTLAAALAESGDFGGAQKTIRLALAVAREPELQRILDRLAESFARSEPWREQQPPLVK